MAEPDFLLRMRAETRDLGAKITALGKFLESEAVKALTDTEKALLEAQHAARGDGLL